MLEYANQYYPISVMLTTWNCFLPVDELTAYLIGWVDGLSERARKFLRISKNMKITPEQMLKPEQERLVKFGVTE